MVKTGATLTSNSYLPLRMAALPAHAITETRELFEAAETNTFAQQLKLERDRQEALIGGESFAEGVRAFVERRKPVFRGR